MRNSLVEKLNDKEELKDVGIDLKVAYTNIDSLLSARLVLNDFLCLVETKLHMDIERLAWEMENNEYGEETELDRL